MMCIIILITLLYFHIFLDRNLATGLSLILSSVTPMQYSEVVLFQMTSHMLGEPYPVLLQGISAEGGFPVCSSSELQLRADKTPSAGTQSLGEAAPHTSLHPVP